MDEAETHQQKPTSTGIAIAMAVVAMLGAVAALRTALAEQDTTRFEHRLDQGKMLGLALRQDFLDTVAIGARFASSYQMRLAEARNAQKEARELGSIEPAKTAALNLKAQEEFAVANSLAPFVNFTRRPLDDKLSLEDSMARWVAADLRDKGFGTIWTGAGSEIWQSLRDDIQRGRSKVRYLAGTVFIFVAALACFTFAQLKHASPKRERWLTRSGYGIALLGIASTLWVDTEAWKTFLLCITGFCLLALVGWILSVKIPFAGRSEEGEPIHPSELEPSVFPGVRIHFAPVQHGFGRFAIAMIAVTAMLSALAGYLYFQAATNSGQAAAEALEQQENAFKTGSLRRATAYFKLGNLTTSQEYRVRLQAARQRLRFVQEGTAGLSQQDTRAQIVLWQRLLNGIDQTVRESLDGVDGPDQDHDFPHRLVSAGVVQEPELAFGLWDGDNELSLNLQRKATTYLAALTLFAIAMYLLGQSLSMGRTRAAFILVVFSCGLVLLGIGSSTLVACESVTPERGSVLPECRDEDTAASNLAEESARHYANGRKLMEMYSEDSQKLREAVREFHCAVAARPTFAFANYYLSLATSLQGTPQLSEGGFVSITSKDSLRNISVHEQKALAVLNSQRFATSPMIQGNFGFDTLLLGLAQKDSGALDRGLTGARTAVSLNDNDPVLRFNFAAALLANGQMQQALAWYEKARGLVTADEGDLVGGAITDLNIVQQYCRGVRSEFYCRELDSKVPTLKAELAAAAWRPGVGSNNARISDLNSTAFPSGLAWSARLHNLDPEQDVLVVIWYALDSDWNVWRVLPAVSGRIAPNAIAENRDRIYQFKSDLRASRQHTCLADGKYRAEVYLNGRMAGESVTSLELGTFAPASFSDLNLAMCSPADWQTAQTEPGLDPDVARAYLAPGGGRGALLFTYYSPRLEPDDAIKEGFMRKSASYVLGQIIAESPLDIDCVAYPLEPRVKYAEYRHHNTTVLAKGWIAGDGFVHVGLVFDHSPEANHEDETHPSKWRVLENCNALVSVSNIY